VAKQSIKILGIAAYYHDSSATLIIDGNIIAAVQEERFSRVKHDPSFPRAAITYCLKQGQCNLSELNAIIFYDKPLLKFERLLETYLALAPKGFSTFLKAIPIWLKEKLYMKMLLRRELKSLDVEQAEISMPQLLFSQHHQSHAASAFYPSPFNKAAIICLDGVGEWVTTSIWLGENESLKPVTEINFPHSLGLLYSAFTYYCGFRVNSGEYKLMGLAPYGKPKYVELIYKHLIEVKQDGSFVLNMKYFDYPTGSVMTNRAFDKLFSGPACLQDSTPTQKQMDLASSIQKVIEEVVLKIAIHTYKITGCENLCLAGGVALNCVSNGRLQELGPFKNIWIQPAAGDAGGSLGSALLAAHQYFDVPRTVKADDQDLMQGSYLGPEFSNKEIQQVLDNNNIQYKKISENNLYRDVAVLLDSGFVVGWFQGRMEFGPRSLGNRSILGDARNQEMQKIMNLKIKNRESFRPFAPAVLAEDVSDYFKTNKPSPYMLVVSEVSDSIRLNELAGTKNGFELLEQKRSTLPAITHVDYSARVQTVDQQTNPRFYNLLNEFKNLTSVSVLINTSFNVRGEPPVCSPEDALRCFLATEMDFLVLNNIIVNKMQMNQSDILEAKRKTFSPD